RRRPGAAADIDPAHESAGRPLAEPVLRPAGLAAALTLGPGGDAGVRTPVFKVCNCIQLSTSLSEGIMPAQHPIPCILMRGGTSKGPYFKMQDIPQEPEIRARVL